MYELLSEPIRRYIRDKRWEALRPIQAAAIQHILPSEKNYILASRTASGKTEAAFLPVLSKINFNTGGVKVVYISPLIALINDQFIRIQQLCDYLDIPVTKWHGEASRTDKENLIRDPRGILLITPESLEAMFVNRPENIKRLMGSLEYIIIDEIHSFLGTNRGVHLQSLLSRLKMETGCSFKIVGLSATIGDYEAVKKLTGDHANTVVLRDKTVKEITADFNYFPGGGAELPLDLLKDLYKNTYENKVLIFPNSRGRAEEIAVKLKKIAERVGGHTYYYSHHSSVDREVREYVEQFAKSNQRFPFAISCTSTLELGIDIGSVDKVVQVDATASIASLIQRVGRSGRKEGMVSSLLFYATDPWSLFQSLACYSLYQEGFVEPVTNSSLPYDVMLQQLLSIVKQLSGCKYDDLKSRLLSNHAFTQITTGDIDKITRYLLSKDILELIGDELIIGVSGEYIVNSRDFYSMFETEINFKVLYQDKTVGEIPVTSLPDVDENIFLAARIWKVIDLDNKTRKIFVKPTNDGKNPKFYGAGIGVHSKIRERMLELLMASTAIPDTSDSVKNILDEYRASFSNYPIKDLQFDRPLIISDSTCILYTFQSTKVNKALHFVLNKLGAKSELKDHQSCISLKCDQETVKGLLHQAYEQLPHIDNWLESFISENPETTYISKWGAYLPVAFQINLLKQNDYDFESLRDFLSNINLITYTEK